MNLSLKSLWSCLIFIHISNFHKYLMMIKIWLPQAFNTLICSDAKKIFKKMSNFHLQGVRYSLFIKKSVPLILFVKNVSKKKNIVLGSLFYTRLPRKQIVSRNTKNWPTFTSFEIVKKIKWIQVYLNGDM